MNKQQRIVGLLRAEYERSVDAHCRSVAECAATLAGANVWNDLHPDDGVGGMSQNPYNVSAAVTKESNSKTHMDNMKEAYDFAVDTFLTK